MKIVAAFPPIYERIAEAFPAIKGREGIVFTFGDTIYAPRSRMLAHHLIIHEETHRRQQERIGIDRWWERYLTDREFRLDQELDAYRCQYRAMNRKEKRDCLRVIAGDLAGPIYGRLISFSDAMDLIAG